MAADEKRPRRWWRTLLIGSGFLLAVGFGLIVWNRAAYSDSFCLTCHTDDPVVVSAQDSVHTDVPCLTCHSGSGLVSSARYLPTFALQMLDQATGISIADGGLEAKSCDACHGKIEATGLLSKEHPGPDSDCESCHGEVAHPAVDRIVAKGKAHPPQYTRLHGRDAARSTSDCASCHEQRFCAACHFKAEFPHPSTWTEDHGNVQQELGAQACRLCHQPTFCKGCHGVEIPHPRNWLSQHFDLLSESTGSKDACLTCHPPVDCTTCHTRHGVHREQSLYGDEGR